VKLNGNGKLITLLYSSKSALLLKTAVRFSRELAVFKCLQLLTKSCVVFVAYFLLCLCLCLLLVLFEMPCDAYHSDTEMSSYDMLLPISNVLFCSLLFSAVLFYWLQVSKWYFYDICTMLLCRFVNSCTFLSTAYCT